MRIRTRPTAAFVVSLLLAFASAPGQAQRRAELPLVRVPAPAGTTGPMILLLSGDGDWAAFPRELGELAAAHGSPVLGLKMRSYLSQRRTPDEMAAALVPVVRGQLDDWGRSEITVIGYSRGADI